MSEGYLSSVPSRTKPPISILKTKPTSASRRGKDNRVSVEINSRQSNGNSGSNEKVVVGGAGHLHEANSQLVAQNHRLISELESTSQQLLQANSKLGELGEELSREKPAQTKVEMLEAQVGIMQEKLSKSASAQWKLDSLASEQQREKNEWRTRQQLLEQRLTNVKQECKRLRESHAEVEERANQWSSSSNSGLLVKSSSSQSLPAANHPLPSASITMTTTSRPHPHHTGSMHKSFLHSSEIIPVANSTLLKLSPPSLSGSTSSLNSVKSTKSAQDFTRFSKPSTNSYQYGRSNASYTASGWSKYGGLTSSTPKSRPSSTTAQATVYQSHLSTTSSYPSFSGYAHHLPSKQPSLSGAGTMTSGYRALKRAGIASSHGSLAVGGGGIAVTSSALKDTANGHRSSMSYLSVGERGERGEVCANGNGGGCDGASTGSDSLSAGQTSDETKRQQRSPLLSPNMELERARAKIRLLQKEVVLLEQQLSDKALSSQSHVEELTRMRTELAQERASIAIFKQEVEEGSSKELDRVKTLHNKQSAELVDQLERLRQEKRERERDTLRLKAELKAKSAEVSSLTERVSSLHNQLEQERRSHDQAMQMLHSEVKGGSQHVSKLEWALRACQDELEGHVTRVEETSRMQKAEVEELQKHVEMLSSELEHTQTQLLDKTELATRLQREISELRGEWQREAASWREREAELKQNLHHGDVLRQSLIQQVERSNMELNSLSGRLTEQQKSTRELKKSQTDLEGLKRHVIEVESEKEHLEDKVTSLKKERQKLLVDLGQEKTRNTKLASQLKQMEREFPSERGRREEAERRVAQLREEVERVKREMEVERERVAEVEVQVREKESTVEDTLSHMQQELAKRAQQVLEMDALLRNHQADTTARRLQLERTLAQRQSELRTRTHEVDELTVKLSEARKKVGEMETEMSQVKSERLRDSSEQKKLLQEKESELSLLKGRLKEVESMGVANSRELGHLKSELGSVGIREREWEERCGELKGQVEQLQRENDSLREQHLTQVQRLHDNHSSLLASREQQANSHRQQLQQLVEQERVRQEELARCRAQVASLSAELAAERRVSDEARRHLALARTDMTRSQAQITSLQKSLHSMSTVANSSAIAPPISRENHTPSLSSSSSLPLHMLSRPITSSAPLDHQAADRSAANAHHTSSGLTLSMSTVSRNDGIIDI